MPACAHCQSIIEESAAYCPYCGIRIEGVAECDDYEYEAFISYRHLPHDTEVAKAIQKHVEGFKIPKELRVDGRGKRLGRMFRDEDELPTSSSLTDQISDALMRSRFLVVVCTPETRESRWVAREVELFSSFHGRDHVLVALAAKEPEDSFPELLLRQKVVRSDGAIELEPTEPLASDFRDPKKYRIESSRIAAALLGCGYDDLHQRLRTRRMRLVSSIAAGVAAVSVAFGAFSAYQQMQIAENYRLAQISESALSADKTNALFEQGDRYEAIQTALSALPDPTIGDTRPYVPAAETALEKALEMFPPSRKWVPSYSQVDVDFWNSCVSDDELMATISEGRYLDVRDVYTGNLVTRIDVRDFARTQQSRDDAMELAYAGDVQLSRDDAVEMAFAGDKLLFAYAGAFGRFDAHTGEQLWKHPAHDSSTGVRDLAVSPDGSLVAVAISSWAETRNYEISILQTANGESTKTVELPDSATTGLGSIHLCFSPAGDTLAAAFGAHAYCIDVKSGKIEEHELHNTWALSVAYAGEYLTFVSSERPLDASGNTTLDVFDANFNFLWERTAEVPTMLDDHFNEYNYLVGACGTWCYSKGEGVAGPDDEEQLVVAFGAELLLLDAKTGAEVYRAIFESPLLGCRVLTVTDGAYVIAAITGKGDIVKRKPKEGHDDALQSTFLDDNVGRVYRGDLFESKNQWFVSVWKSDPSKHVMYRTAAKRDYLDLKPFEGLGDLSFMSNNRVYTKTDTTLSVYAFEHNDIELLQTYDLASFGQLARPDRAISHVSDLEPGKMYIAGQVKAADGGDTNYDDDVVVYALDESGDAPLTKLDVPDAGFVSSMATGMDEASGHIQLLVQSSHLVTVVDTQTGEVVQQIDRESATWENPEISLKEAGEGETVENQMRSGTIDSAFFAGENILVCQSVRVSGSTDYETDISLVNRATGDTLDADISRYPGPSNALYTMSDDGMLFAMECQDGAVRLFDMQTGTLVWETFDLPSGLNCLSLVGNGDVFYQKESGVYGLLSGKTGKVKRESQSTLPTLQSGCLYRPDQNELIVFNKGGHYASVGGLAIISLDEDGFGARSIIDEGMAVSADGTAVLLKLNLGDLRIVRKLSLEEMQTRAHEMLEAHGM